MSIKKTEIIEAIKALPQEEFINIDELLQEIVLISKIEKGLNDMEVGRVLSEEELDKTIEQW